MIKSNSELDLVKKILHGIKKYEQYREQLVFNIGFNYTSGTVRQSFIFSGWGGGRDKTDFNSFICEIYRIVEMAHKYNCIRWLQAA